MKKILEELLKKLTEEEIKKDIVNLEFTEELKNLLINGKVTIKTQGETNKSPLGIVSFNDTKDLFYKNSIGELIVKPILIKKYLDSL